MADVVQSLIETARVQMAQAFVSAGNAALAYSGGLESNLLLALAEPYRDRVAVFMTRTGDEFPHMVAFTDAALARWNHHIVRTDVKRFFNEIGLPANVIPIEHQPAAINVFGAVRQPVIVPWVECCFLNRSLPLWEAMRAAGFTKVIHGQRDKDWLGKRTVPAMDGLEVFTPLRTNTRQEVRSMIEALGVEIPAHYSEFSGSLDCATCPASLTPKRRTYMGCNYPEHLARAEAIQALVTDAVRLALTGVNTLHDYDQDAADDAACRRDGAQEGKASEAGLMSN